MCWQKKKQARVHLRLLEYYHFYELSVSVSLCLITFNVHVLLQGAQRGCLIRGFNRAPCCSAWSREVLAACGLRAGEASPPGCEQCLLNVTLPGCMQLQLRLVYGDSSALPQDGGQVTDKPVDTPRPGLLRRWPFVNTDNRWLIGVSGPLWLLLLLFGKVISS